MSAPVKRTVLALVAAILTAAFSTLFAITLARLVRQHQTENDGDSAAEDPEATASTSPAVSSLG